MRVRVRLFARLREIVGVGEVESDLNEGATVGDLLKALHAEYPKLADLTSRTVISVNQEFVTPDNLLSDGDEVAIFPPVSGGVDPFRVTFDPITLDEVAGLVVRPHTGAVATFAGVVRNVTGDNEVAYLEYEAYEPMAVRELERIRAEAQTRWPKVRLAVAHRLGRLEVGEAAVVIVAAAPHRPDAFDACRYTIDTLKKTVPIWKKEFGEEGSCWVEENP